MAFEIIRLLLCSYVRSRVTGGDAHSEHSSGNPVPGRRLPRPTTLQGLGWPFCAVLFLLLFLVDPAAATTSFFGNRRNAPPPASLAAKSF